MRTIKTVITATLGIIIATKLGLMFPSTAGIVAILSVTNTKKSSFKIGVGRLIAFVIATGIAFIAYQVLGYQPMAFGLFLLCYIPIAARLNMSEAIPVNSVLMTHFLNEQSMSWSLIMNAMSLLCIGVGLALIANLYMPNVEGDIQANKKTVDVTIQLLLFKLSQLLKDPGADVDCQLLIEGIAKSLKQGEEFAKRQADNQLLLRDLYDQSYFQMRRMQLQVLEDMHDLIKMTTVEREAVEDISLLLKEIGLSFSEKNDAVGLKERVKDVYRIYETKSLPQTRAEFENRARLYQLLTEIQTFIDIKVNFTRLQEK